MIDLAPSYPACDFNACNVRNYVHPGSLTARVDFVKVARSAGVSFALGV